MTKADARCQEGFKIWSEYIQAYYLKNWPAVRLLMEQVNEHDKACPICNRELLAVSLWRRPVTVTEGK